MIDIKFGRTQDINYKYSYPMLILQYSIRVFNYPKYCYPLTRMGKAHWHKPTCANSH